MRPIRIALVAAVVVPFSLLSAQQPAAPAGVHHAAVVTTDVVYGHKAGMALTFDVYRPRTPNGAAVISVLSAGWRSGWDSLQQFQEQPDGSVRMMTAAAIAAAPGVLPSHSYVGLLDKGFTVFAVRHGSSPTFGMPDIVSDMRRAVRVDQAPGPRLRHQSRPHRAVGWKRWRSPVAAPRHVRGDRQRERQGRGRAGAGEVRRDRRLRAAHRSRDAVGPLDAERAAAVRGRQHERRRSAYVFPDDLRVR